MAFALTVMIICSCWQNAETQWFHPRRRRVPCFRGLSRTWVVVQGRLAGKACFPRQGWSLFQKRAAGSEHPFAACLPWVTNSGSHRPRKHGTRAMPRVKDGHSFSQVYGGDQGVGQNTARSRRLPVRREAGPTAGGNIAAVLSAPSALPCLLMHDPS